MSNSLDRRHKQTLVVMLKLLVVMGLNWISEVRDSWQKTVFFYTGPVFFLLRCSCNQWLIQKL